MKKTSSPPKQNKKATSKKPIKKHSKQYVMVTLHTSWADECDFQGFSVVKKEYWEKYRKNWIKCLGKTGKKSSYFGTNQRVDVYLKEYTVQEITIKEYETLKKMDLLSFGCEVFINEDEELEEGEEVRCPDCGASYPTEELSCPECEEGL